MQGRFLDVFLDVFFQLQLTVLDFIKCGGRNLQIPESLPEKESFPPRVQFEHGEKGALGSLDSSACEISPLEVFMRWYSEFPKLPECAVSPSNLFVIHFCSKCCQTCYFL